jgi:pimeloyl-ACP methyl ester carboxylesterase
MKLINGRMTLRLHELRGGEGLPLLLLHELGGRAEDWRSRDWSAWEGSVYALDFAGHGASDRVKGGGYYPELFLSDADLALEALDDYAAVAGAGVGAYVALLLAGARPDRVAAALLLSGRGLEGGGDEPDFDAPIPGLQDWETRLGSRAEELDPDVDPAVSRCETDFRPGDYVADFARAAGALLFDPAVEHRGCEPAWWRSARECSGGATSPDGLSGALARLRQIAG